MTDSAAFIHPTALVESPHVGSETRVWAFAHILEGAQVGRACNICDHVYIEGGARVGNSVTIKNNVMVWDKVTIEDEVFLGPNVVLTNDLRPRVAFKTPPEEFLPTLIRRGASVGANATIVCGVTVGEQAMIGAGTVVIADVPAHSLVVGNPARQIGWVCACGKTLPESLRCSCGRRYRQASSDAGLTALDS